MLPQDLLRAFFTWTLVILSRVTHAIPTTSNTQPLLSLNTTVTTPFLDPYCFNSTSWSGIGTITNRNDCIETLRLIYAQPDFETPYRFSRHESAGKYSFRQLPRRWQYGGCRILFGVNDEDLTAVYTYKEVAQKVPIIIRECIDRKEVKYGGVEPMDSASYFYVSIGRPFGPGGVSIGASGGPGNTTLVGNGTLVSAAFSDLGGDDSEVLADS